MPGKIYLGEKVSPLSKDFYFVLESNCKRRDCKEFVERVNSRLNIECKLGNRGLYRLTIFILYFRKQFTTFISYHSFDNFPSEDTIGLNA